jgi:hypothetical protein
MTTDKLPPTRRVICGRYAGYQAHRKAGEQVCSFCREARNAWERGRRAARATAAERARLTSDEITALYTAAEDLRAGAYVEDLIARRLLRYTTHAPEERS